MTSTILCIYCRQPAGSKEHLFPRNLGATLTAPILCHGCNNAMSVLDQHLAEQSVIALPRTVKTTGFKVRLGKVTHIKVDGRDQVAIKLTNGPSIQLVPQIHFLGDFESGIQAEYLGEEEDYQGFRKTLERHVKEDFAKTRVQVDSNLTHSVLLEPEGKKLLLRVPDADAAEHLKVLLKDQWHQAMPESPDTTPVVSPAKTVPVTLKFNESFLKRAVAKIAFNMLANVVGVEAVMDPSFDSARQYIRYGVATKEVQVGVFNDQDWRKYFQPEEGVDHEVFLHIDEEAFVLVEFYQFLTFFVHFTEGQLPAACRQMSPWRFNGDRNNQVDLQGQRSFERLIEHWLKE